MAYIPPYIIEEESVIGIQDIRQTRITLAVNGLHDEADSALATRDIVGVKAPLVLAKNATPRFKI
jgi:hypothetical protein